MPTNPTAEAFYKAFQQKDFKTMQGLYADSATFSDAAFHNLNAKEARAMWEMLISRGGGDTQITYEVLRATEQNGRQEVQTRWIATYTFSLTGRKVVNDITANMLIENGRIVQHIDKFSFYKWARQAFGFTGLLLGWTPFFQKKVQTTARQNLDKFMQAQKTQTDVSTVVGLVDFEKTLPKEGDK